MNHVRPVARGVGAVNKQPPRRIVVLTAPAVSLPLTSNYDTLIVAGTTDLVVRGEGLFVIAENYWRVGRRNQA